MSPAPSGLISPQAHLDRILGAVAPLEPVELPLADALGLCLVDDVVSGLDLPRFDNSAMDGYAVQAADVADATAGRPVVLPVNGEIHAGAAPTGPLRPGEAVKIMTGAPVPPGADAVVPYELTDRGSETVAVRSGVRLGANIRRAGGDVTTGTTVLRAGAAVGPRQVGLLASLGAARVTVRRRPRVLIAATGDELREPGEALDSHAIYDSNSHLLAAVVTAAGGQPVRSSALGDDPTAFRERLVAQLADVDLAVTTGGVSQGDKDVVKHALAGTGEVQFDQVAMRPGKPQGFGVLTGVPIITLPGNAVSAFVSFEVFVRPALRQMMGRSPVSRPTTPAALSAGFDSPRGLREFVRGTLRHDGDQQVFDPIVGSASHQIGALAGANALALVDADRVEAGESIPVWDLERAF